VVGTSIQVGAGLATCSAVRCSIAVVVGSAAVVGSCGLCRRVVVFPVSVESMVVGVVPVSPRTAVEELIGGCIGGVILDGMATGVVLGSCCGVYGPENVNADDDFRFLMRLVPYPGNPGVFCWLGCLVYSSWTS
jgi:hypothetical protein